MTGHLLAILAWLVAVAALTTQNTALGIVLYLAGWGVLSRYPSNRSRL